MAHLPLTSTHRRGRVALQDLARAEALLPRAVEVLDIDVLAEAHDSFPGGFGECHVAVGHELLSPPGRGSFLFRGAGIEPRRGRITDRHYRQPRRLAREICPRHEPQ